jgi:hypothetical protein
MLTRPLPSSLAGRPGLSRRCSIPARAAWYNEYNRRVFRYVHDEALAGRGVMISLTDCYRHTSYGEPIVALKSYILSPFVDEEHVEAVVRKVLEARAHVEAGPGA